MLLSCVDVPIVDSLDILGNFGDNNHESKYTGLSVTNLVMLLGTVLMIQTLIFLNNYYNQVGYNIMHFHFLCPPSLFLPPFLYIF